MSAFNESPCLESTPIQLRPGKIERKENKIVYRTIDGLGQAKLPAHAEIYINALNKISDIETLILDHLQRGTSVDYRLLKTTILGLYLGGCIRNTSDLRPYVEAWQQPPMREPSLIRPLIHSKASRRSAMIADLPLFFAAAVSLMLWLATLLSQSASFFGDALRFWIFLFLTPSAILSLQTLAVWIFEHVAGAGNSQLGARLSPLGIHIESDGRAYREKPIESLAIATVAAFALSAFANRNGLPIVLAQAGSAAAADFLRQLTVIFASITLLPGFRTPLSQARAELMKRGQMTGPSASPALNGVFVTLAIVGLCGAFGAIADTTIATIRYLFSLISTFSINGFAGLVIVAWSVTWASLLVSDLLGAVECLADDLDLIAPLRDSMSLLWIRVIEGKPQSEGKRIHDTINRHPLFQSLPDGLRTQLAAAARLVRAPKGSRLIRQDSHSKELYLLVTGSAGVYLHDRATINSELLLRLSAGSVFGEAGFFLDQARTADVVTLENSVLIRIPRPPTFNPRENVHGHEVFRNKILLSDMLLSHSLF